MRRLIPTMTSISRLQPVRCGLLLVVLALGMATAAAAWPTDNEWQPLLKSGSSIQDTGGGGKTGNNDASGSSNIVPDINDPVDVPSAYLYNDGAYMYYRLRIDTDPSGGGGQGVLQQFGWGLEIDSNQNPDNYEWLIMVDGIASPETVNLQQNTTQGTLGDPSDVAEITVASYPLPGNHRILLADTSINGDQDYFLDFRIPYQVFLTATGLNENSLLRYFAGTSKSANNLTNNGADLLGGSDLYNGLADYLTPGGGTMPCGGFTDGTVRFVNSLDGFVDIQLITPGNAIFIRVDDPDQNLQRNPSQTVRVSVTTDRGDAEVVTLSATGVAGKFSGTLATRSGNVSIRSGTLDLPNNANDTVRATYLDAITANCLQNQTRTDSLVSTNTQTDLYLVKSVSNLVPTPSSPITYTLVVTNNGPLTATNFTVTDIQPGNVTFGAVTAPPTTSWAFAGGTGTWTIPSLAVGASLTLTIPATVGGGAAGTINNIAQINYANDGYAANNSAMASIHITGTDLRITKSVSNATPAIGQQVTYSVRVFNLGPNPVTGVVVNDVLPTAAPTAYLSYNSSTPSQGTFTDTLAPLNGVPDTWSVGSLPVGAGASLDIVATVTPGTAGASVINTATLNTGGLSQPDINSSNNSARATFLAGAIDLQVTKSASNYGPAQNNPVTYTVQIHNNGPNSASGIVLRDILPAGVSYQSHTVSQGSFIDNMAPAGTPETWNVGNLAKDATATLTITVQVMAPAGTTIHNVASLLAVDQFDTDNTNDADDAPIEVGGTDLHVTKLSRRVTAPVTAFADTTLVQPNNQVEFQVTVTNFGPNSATSVELTDILPVGVSYVSSTATQGSYDGGNNGTKIWAVGTVGVNQSATLTIVANVANGASGTITNVAMLTRCDQNDTDNTNNIGNTKLVVNAADLGITKDVNNITPSIGQDIIYTLTVTNYGPGNATNIRVRDLIPPELTYKSSAPSQGTFTDLVAPLNGIPDTWAVGTINYTGNPTNDRATLTITATVKGFDANLQIQNVAQIAAVDQSDPITINNTANNIITVQGTDVAVIKTVSTITPVEGTDFTYTVSVGNDGSFAATNLEIEDLLPATLDIVSITPSSGAYLGGLWYLASLGSKATATLQIVAKPKIGTAGTPIINTARVNYLDQTDSNTGNNSSSVSVTPQLAPANLTILKFSNKATAQPGETILYTVQIANTGTGPANVVVVRDSMSPHLALVLDPFSNGTPFRFTELVPATGVVPDMTNFTIAPSGAWQLPMTGSMAAGGRFALEYQATVK
jgi:uncharacterized repeat protein (TIGR01451 family)